MDPKFDPVVLTLPPLYFSLLLSLCLCLCRYLCRCCCVTGAANGTVRLAALSYPFAAAAEGAFRRQRKFERASHSFAPNVIIVARLLLLLLLFVVLSATACCLLLLWRRHLSPPRSALGLL